jgi:hypothetical protein
MSNVVQMPLPVKATVRKILAEKFVDYFIDHSKKGIGHEQALYKAKYDLQEFVITSMYLMPHNSEELYKCYHEIKDDRAVQEKAKILFDLTDHQEIAKKYMHYLTV